MTRYTNFARKRTYVEAGFNLPSEVDSAQSPETVETQGAEPPKKRRSAFGYDQAQGQEPGGERSSVRVFKATGANAVTLGDGVTDGAPDEGSARQRPREENIGKKAGMKDANARKQASERRRVKRQDERHAETVCFACREKGHAAKYCTKALQAGPEEELDEASAASNTKLGKNSVGICYRCGSRKHNLSKCKSPVDPLNPLPFASCFVCSGTGHLASSCPKNGSRGIYPNGGCCKLCGETTHLAKDCSLRKQEMVSKTVFLGTGKEAGADEDDFHTFKRRNAEVDKSEKQEQRAKRQVNVKIGAHSGVVKSFAKVPALSKAKVVCFE